jgi:hypothetical protein
MQSILQQKSPDLELLRLERALHQARDRLGWITLLVPDAAVRRAAEDLCAEAAAAVDAHGGRAMFAEPRRR